MGPGFAAPEREIVGIGHLAIGRLLWLDQLIRDALALAIGHRLFLAVEIDRELLLHVAGGGPPHQRLDRSRLFRFVFKPPFLGLGSAGLHRVFGRPEDARGHGWLGSLRNAILKPVVETSKIGFKALALIPTKRHPIFDPYSHYAAL